MRLQVMWHNNSWAVLAPPTSEYATIVAQVEGLALEDVTFNGSVLTGVIKAAWGVQITDDRINTSRSMVHALGIGGVFDSPADIPFEYRDGFYLCGETSGRLHSASHVMLFNQGKFYGK